MAPPATQARGGQQPLGQRLAALAQTLQFGWFMGHLTLLLCTLRYTISFVRFNTNTGTANFVYRLAFISAAATYGIVVYKAYRARLKQGGIGMAQIQSTGLAMLGDENVQYLIMALIWLCSKSIYIALLPFTIYSTFHFLTYLRTALIPTILPTPTAPPPYPTSPSSPSDSSSGKRKTPSAAPNIISDTISKFVKSHYDTSMMIVANLEIALLVRLFLGCCIFVNSWILLAVYALFLRIRVGQSAFLRQALVSTEVRVDALLADGRVPPAIRDGWRGVKDVIKKVGAATDVADATGGKVGGTPSVARPRKTE